MVLQRLNMDNTWFLHFGGVRILVDPWLKGAEVDYFSWFNKQWHRTNPVSIEEVPPYDLVLITQKYPDHFHPETLNLLSPERLLVPKSIEEKVRKVCPKAFVSTLSDTSTLLGSETVDVLHLPSHRSMDPIYDGIVLYDTDESVLLATHGYHPSWTSLLRDIPPLKVALTPFNEYKLPKFLGGAVSPGIDAVRDMIVATKPQHVVATHDEDKYAQGLISKLARITLPPSDDILRSEDLFKDRLLTIEDYQPVSI